MLAARALRSLAATRRAISHAFALQTQGKFAEAVRTAEAACKEMDELLQQAAGFDDDDGEAAEAFQLISALIGEFLLDIGDYRRALPALDRAARLARQVHEVSPGRIRTLRRLAMAHAAVGDVEAAISVAEEALSSLTAAQDDIRRVVRRYGGTGLASLLFRRNPEVLDMRLELADYRIRAGQGGPGRPGG